MSLVRRSNRDPCMPLGSQAELDGRLYTGTGKYAECHTAVSGALDGLDLAPVRRYSQSIQTSKFVAVGEAGLPHSFFNLTASAPLEVGACWGLARLRPRAGHGAIRQAAVRAMGLAQD